MVVDIDFDALKTLVKDSLSIVDGGQIPKIEVVENALRELSHMGDSDYNKQILMYKDEKEKLFKSLNEINKQIEEMVDKYYNALVKGL